MTGWEVQEMEETAAHRQWEDMWMDEDESDAYSLADSSVADAITELESADELLNDAASQVYSFSDELYDKITSIRSDLNTLLKAVGEIKSKLERR